MSKAKGHGGHDIVGLLEAEYERQEALPRRPLKPSDIPQEPWRPGYEDYELREDGVIVASNISVPLGFVRKDGTVAWTRC